MPIMRERYAIHPGEHVADELAELKMSQAALARALGIPRARVSEILRGRRRITADTALRLSRWIGTTPEYWMGLQDLYDLRVAEAEHGEEIARTVTPLAREEEPAGRSAVAAR